MRLPDFLIIGSAKAGTTTLYEYLCRHPQIYMSDPKEPEFFARDENYSRGLTWYSSLFVDAKPEQVCGEASTIYTRSPQFPKAPSRIAQALPNAKLIYLMRHPVDRAFSHYVQQIKTAQNTQTQLKLKETFEQAIESQKCLLDSSHYLAQIQHYLDFFPRESFLFLFMDDLIQNPSQTLHQVCDFLEIDLSIDLIQKQPIAANQAKNHATWFLRSRITAPLKSIPGMKTTIELLPQNFKDRAYNILKSSSYGKQVEKSYIARPMLQETRQLLLQKFYEPNQQLADFLNRDLSAWNQ